MWRLFAVALLVIAAGVDCSPGNAGQPPTPEGNIAPTEAELIHVAAGVYPWQGWRYVTCNFASQRTGYAACPVTSRLSDRLTTVFAGFISAPEPLGGGSDPEWATESITAEPAGTGGIAHVVLAKPSPSSPSRYDLVIIRSGGKLLVDDLFCTGSDPTSSSIYVDGWMGRAEC